MNLFDFDPTSLVQTEDSSSKQSGNPIIYNANPSRGNAEDGHYRSTIKVIFNPFSFKDSVVERQSYSITDENGWFEACSSLTNNDVNCPIFKAWKSLRYSSDPLKNSWAAPEYKGGKGWFNKKTERWVTIQVLEDKNHPELEGQYMLWKMPKFIWTLISSKQTPSVESGKASIPVMDFLIGRAVELDVTPGPDDKTDPTRKNREISYDLSSLSEDPVACTNPDGSSLISEEQEEIVDKVVSMLKKVWKERNVEKRNEMMAKLQENADVKEFNRFYEEEVVPKIRQFCPNVKEEMQFKPWTPELEARVNAWLAKVTNGIDPTSVASITVASTNPNSTSTDVTFTACKTDIDTQSKPTQTVTVAPESDEDDLPF